MSKYFLILILVALGPITAVAADVAVYTSIPFLNGEQTTQAYVQALYRISVSLAAIVAVIRLIWAGTEYMLSDLITSKQAAKDKIKGSIFGLILILGAVTILQTINPNLTGINELGGDGTTIVREAPPQDDVRFTPGEVWNAGEIINHCSGWFSTNTRCTDEYVEALRMSCEVNGGAGIARYWNLIRGFYYECLSTLPTPTDPYDISDEVSEALTQQHCSTGNCTAVFHVSGDASDATARCDAEDGGGDDLLGPVRIDGIDYYSCVTNN